VRKKKKRVSEERPEYYARTVVVLRCVPANFDNPEGEPASVITLGHVKDGSVGPWVIDVPDSRKLAVGLLIALATNSDEFAQKLLDDHFAADDHGHFVWPDEPYQLW
jgi:hypothetical protein